jgi:hypothetical protein
MNTDKKNEFNKQKMGGKKYDNVNKNSNSKHQKNLF